MQKTCAHFQPSAVASSHDGVFQNPQYKYANPVKAHVCCHPERNAKETSNATLGCTFAANMQACGYYKPIEDKVLLQAENDDFSIQLVETKVDEGFIAHQIIDSKQNGQIVVLHSDKESLKRMKESFYEVVELCHLDIVAPEVPKKENTYLTKVLGK